MRIVWKAAFAFLVLPIALMAQDPPPSGPPDPQQQGPPGANDNAPGSEPLVAPNPLPEPITPLVQPPPRVDLRTIKRPPIAPGFTSALSVSAGYSVTNLALPSSGRTTLTGTDVSVTAENGSLFGARFDVGYGREGNVFGTQHHLDVLSYMIGPVIFLSRNNLIATYADVLVGGARVAGPLVNPSGQLGLGYVHYPAFSVGGGVEYPFSRGFALRVSVDYLRTHYFDNTGAVRGQNDIRVVNSIVYYFGQPSNRRRR